MCRPFNHDKILIFAHGAFVDMFTVANEVVALHGHH